MARKEKKVRTFSALEVADICGVVNQTAINWIRNGFLKAFMTPGGQYRVYLEDLLAFLRREPEFRNVAMAELPNGDFGRTILRNFLVAAWQRELWHALAKSSDAELAAIAAKSLKETRYHLQHASDWVIRLGDGTEESHRRMQDALDTLWPYTAEFFSGTPTDDVAVATSVGPAWSSLQPAWTAAVTPVLEVATLKIPANTPFLTRGKLGMHSEHFGHLLTEMQYLQRTYPGGTW